HGSQPHGQNMSAGVADPVQSLAPFANEPLTDFSQPASRQKMESALSDVRSQFGREYDLWVAGRRVNTGDKLRSLNPSHPNQLLGIHNKATVDLANEAVESAPSFFAEWSST